MIPRFKKGDAVWIRHACTDEYSIAAVVTKVLTSKREVPFYYFEFVDIVGRIGFRESADIILRAQTTLNTFGGVANVR